MAESDRAEQMLHVVKVVLQQTIMRRGEKEKEKEGEAFLKFSAQQKCALYTEQETSRSLAHHLPGVRPILERFGVATDAVVVAGRVGVGVDVLIAVDASVHLDRLQVELFGAGPRLAVTTKPRAGVTRAGQRTRGGTRRHGLQVGKVE